MFGGEHYLGRIKLDNEYKCIHYNVDGDFPNCFWLDVYEDKNLLLSVEIDDEIGYELYISLIHIDKNKMIKNNLQNIFKDEAIVLNDSLYKLHEYLDDDIVIKSFNYMKKLIVDKINKESV